jgi:elongator complex protein 2
VADDVNEFQTISLQGYYPLSLALAYLPSSEGEGLSIFPCRGAHFGAAIILAIGGTDRNVRIWTRSDGQVGSHI